MNYKIIKLHHLPIPEDVMYGRTVLPYPYAV